LSTHILLQNAMSVPKNALRVEAELNSWNAKRGDGRSEKENIQVA